MAAATLKIHGLAQSAPTMRVLACAHEKKLPYELIPVDLRNGANMKPDFLSLNPFGKIPVLQDGDLTLFESRAITAYIAHKFAGNGTELIFPGDVKKMALLSVSLEVETCQFDPVASSLTFELLFKNYLGQTTDETAVRELELKFARILDVYDTRLSECKYLAGDFFSMADLHHMPQIHYLLSTEIRSLFESRPNLNRWCQDILTRPAWKEVLSLAKKA